MGADALDPRNWKDGRCEFVVSPTPPSVAALKKFLDPNKVLGTGCKVKKHPDCCLLCRENERCENLPVHVNCRCTREPVLMDSGFDSDPALGAQASSFLGAQQQGIKRG